MRYLQVKNGQIETARERLGTVVEGKVSLYGKRHLTWGPHGPEEERECLQDYPIPPGWSLAYDLNVEINRAIYRLTLHGSSIKKSFLPYLVQLAARNLRLADVTTRITVTTTPTGRARYTFSAIL